VFRLEWTAASLLGRVDKSPWSSKETQALAKTLQRKALKLPPKTIHGDKRANLRERSIEQAFDKPSSLIAPC
jgi:hypothetical protein